MKKHLLSLLALCLMGVSGVQAQSEVTLAGKSAEGPSVAKAPVSARAPKPDASKTCNPATSDPAIIAGSWRAVDNSALLLTEDGKATVSGNSAVTDFEYFPYRGDLVLLNADGAVVQNYHVLRLSKDYLVFRLVGGSYAVYYPSDRFATSLTMSDTDVVIWKGKTQKLSIEHSPAESILPALVWTSSDPKVASVSADGVVTAVATGTCTITAGTGDGTLNASCSVVVKDYEYVDLGLPSGTLWATYNVGASSPEEYGDYFAWGEVKPKSSYTWENYKYCKGTSDSMTKYCMDENQGVVDGLTSLSTDDDAAYQTWGENWRMPRTVQFEELYNSAYTTVEWIELNGKGGHLITSKINGNTLFLPNAGYSQDGSYSTDGWGYYWSRNVYEENDVYYCAHGLNIGNTASLFQTDYYQHRYMGLSVRPVYEDAKANLPKMDASELALHVGDTHQLTVSSPLYNIPSNSVDWTSSNSAVATVGQFGLVTALKPGTCTITASAKGGGWTVTCDIVVKDYEYVDLGLPSRTLWGTCNVGASSPEDNGDYFAWGETTTKSSYTWETYLDSEDGSSEKFKKYYIDGVKDELDLKDDAAYVNLGEDWRMPTKDQQEELADPNNCSWEWKNINGKNGYLVTSNLNGASIFLPAAGYRNEGSLDYDGEYGEYWSRSLSSDYSNSAYSLYFDWHAVVPYGYRYYGRSVRPVYVGTKAKISESELALHVGDTHQLTVSSPLYNIPSNSVDWTSSNSAVATVGQFGLVTAQMPGTCTITASAKGGGWSLTCDIVVEDYEYVDLGLPSGTLWATCNVGASSPEDYGDYFAWGETTSKSSYTWDNYFDSEGGSPVFFYTFYHGTRNDKLGLTELGDAYDAAYNNWCANWHMPTAEQASELFAKCTWKWNKEKLGYDVVGPNGNAIFLPTAGYYDGASCSESTQKGYFWTRSLTPVYSGYADIISIASNQHEKRSATRNWGLPIRPVYEKAKDTTPSMNASELTLHVGDTHLLKVTSPLYDIPSNSINWTSSNSGVASVSQFGLVTALKPGTCTITASAKGGGWSLTCDIVVKDQVNKTFTVNGVNFDMKLVEAGTFMMGSEDGDDAERPVHSVTISKDYYIGETEVTQGLWYAVMGQKPTSDGYQWESQYGLGDNYPAYYISWDDCQEFITKLNEFTGQTFRMPTEAEWEFAARGGNKSQGYTYSGSNTIDEVAWYRNNSYNMGEESPDYGTHPVATKKANELGLYDMSGNVWECCNDWYDDYGNTAVTDPAGATSGSGRVARGGSWNVNAKGCRAAYRIYITPTGRGIGIGFRLALSPSK